MRMPFKFCFLPCSATSMRSFKLFLALAGSALALPALEKRQEYAPLSYAPDECSGYVASNVEESDTLCTMDLQLAGPACNAFSAVGTFMIFADQCLIEQSN